MLDMNSSESCCVASATEPRGIGHIRYNVTFSICRAAHFTALDASLGGRPRLPGLPAVRLPSARLHSRNQLFEGSSCRERCSQSRGLRDPAGRTRPHSGGGPAILAACAEREPPGG